MILMLQSNFWPSRGYLVRVAAVDQATLTAKAVTSIGASRHFWHSSNCVEMVFGIKSQINKPSHTERLISLTHSWVSSKYSNSNNQFWDCVLSVQSRTSPTNHHSLYSWNSESLDTTHSQHKTSRNCVLSKPCKSHGFKTDFMRLVSSEYWMVEVETFYLEPNNWARVQLGTEQVSLKVWMVHRGHSFFQMLWNKIKCILRNSSQV